MSDEPDMEYLELCPVCIGKGEYFQTYTGGCGVGSYRSMGPCDYCKHPSQFMKGLGYRMKDGSEVPASVVNQLEVLGVIEKR